MRLARHFAVHSDFDLETPLQVGSTEYYAHNQLDQAIMDYYDLVHHTQYNVRLVAVILDDFNEHEQVLLQFRYLEDPEPNENNTKAHRDWLMRQGEPPEPDR